MRGFDPDTPHFLVRAVAASLGLALAACLAGQEGLIPAPGAGAIPLRPPVKALQVQAAFGDKLWLRIRFPAPQDVRQRYFHYLGGGWKTEGGGFRDLEASKDADPARGATDHLSALSETVLSVAINDPSATSAILSFDKFGCYPACHEHARQMPDWRASDGEIPMKLFPGFGGFADLWAWRAHRTGLAGFADDLSLDPTGIVPDAGTPAWTDLALTSGGHPAMVLASTAGFAVPWSSVLGSGPFAMSDGSLAGMPAAMSWSSAALLGYVPKQDDAVPAQLLTLPRGGRADVAATASWAAGSWDLTLSRKPSTGDPRDVVFGSGHRYGLAFALHSEEGDGRDHYAAFPVSLLLGTSGAGVVAGTVPAGASPDFSDEQTYPVTEVLTVLPGVTSYDFTVGAVFGRNGLPRTNDVVHGGHLEVASGQYACSDCHRISSTQPVPSHENAGDLERLTLRRGGVYEPTPFFGEGP